MNSIEAILATSALLLCFGVLLTILNEQSNRIDEAKNIIEAKATALNCGAIIDSITSNSAEEYEKEIECKGEKNRLKATVEGKSKETQTIAEVENKYSLQVKKPEHYLE